MVEQFEEARQHNVLHSVLRSDDRWDALQASARYPRSFTIAYRCEVEQICAFRCFAFLMLFASIQIYLLIVAILALDESKHGLQAKVKHGLVLMLYCT